MHAPPHSLIYQAAGPWYPEAMEADFDLARRAESGGWPVGRIYGSGLSAVVALGHAALISAQRDPQGWRGAGAALEDLQPLLRWRREAGYPPQLRSIKWGLFSMGRLRRWLGSLLTAWAGRPADSLKVSDLALPLYLLAAEAQGYPVFLGPPETGLGAQWHNAGTEIEDAPLLDAVIASASTLLLFPPLEINGRWLRGSRPIYADITSLVLDMEAQDPRPLADSTPYTPIPKWHGMALSQPFIMHHWTARNQADLSRWYSETLAIVREREQHSPEPEARAGAAQITHIRLPYTGSSRAAVNIQQTIDRIEEWGRLFREMGEPQVARVDFSRPLALVYGAGGFSGILAQTVLARMITERGAQVQRVYGCSAGVISGLFHGVTLAATQHPELYRPEAIHALRDFAGFFDGLSVKTMFEANLAPWKLWRAVANMKPLRTRLLGYLERWTGRSNPDQLRFSDMQLPLRMAMTRGSDGYQDFAGMPGDGEARFGGHRIQVIDCPVIDALQGGMAQPFYLTPKAINGETYFDGGASYYEIDHLAALLEQAENDNLPGLLSIHTGEPIPYSYGFPPRMHLWMLAFEIHNLTMAELRRRSSMVADLLYRLG